MATMSSAPGGATAPADFSMLAESSLPSFSDYRETTFNPSWTKSLQELKIASTALLGNTGGTTSAAEEASAHSLLARERGLDMARLSRMSRLLESRPTALVTDTVSAAESTLGVEEFLRKNQEGVFERILSRERSATRAKSHQLVEHRMKQDWDAERDRWIKELAGHRTLGGAAAAASDAPPPTSRTTGSSIVALPTAATPYAAKRATTVVNPSMAPSASTSTLDAREVRSHVALVARLNQTNKSAFTPSDVFEEFERVVADGRGSSGQQAAYGTSWKLLQSMSCRRHKALPVEAAMGALAHFCHQFHNHVTNRVRAATMAGQFDSSSQSLQGGGMVGIVSAYVKLELGATTSPWPIVYYSLRCGDMVAAKSALDAATGTAGDENLGPAVRHVLSQLVQVQGSAQCLWDSGSAPVISAQDRQPLVNLYHRAKTREPVDPFMVASLALLSLAEPVSSATNLVNTIEDYLFGALWNIVQRTNPDEEIASLGEDIKHWGPEHFADTEESGGWAYTLPLLAAQQYKTGLSYLADAGGAMGLLQATHLALVLALAGTDLVDLGPDSSLETPSLLPALLVSYASHLQAVDAAAALEYLVRIPDPARVRKEISRLVAETKAYDLLGGTLQVDGSRDRRGALDNHFPPEKVSQLLADAAAEADNRKNVSDAAQLLWLAGHYDALLSLLNRQLASHLASSPNADKMFWQQAAQRFRSLNLASGRTHVTEVLEAQGKMSLVNTFNLLMELTTFVDRLSAQKYEEAWSVVERLNLLPDRDMVMSSKVQQFHSLDAVLKDNFSVVLLGSMESLYQQHMRLKSTMHGVSSDSVHQRLKELRTRARLLVTFTGLLQLEKTGDTSTRIAQLEANMM